MQVSTPSSKQLTMPGDYPWAARSAPSSESGEPSRSRSPATDAMASSAAVDYFEGSHVTDENPLQALRRENAQLLAELKRTNARVEQLAKEWHQNATGAEPHSDRKADEMPDGRTRRPENDSSTSTSDSRALTLARRDRILQGENLGSLSATLTRRGLTGTFVLDGADEIPTVIRSIAREMASAGSEHLTRSVGDAARAANDMYWTSLPGKMVWLAWRMATAPARMAVSTFGATAGLIFGSNEPEPRRAILAP